MKVVTGESLQKVLPEQEKLGRCSSRLPAEDERYGKPDVSKGCQFALFLQAFCSNVLVVFNVSAHRCYMILNDLACFKLERQSSEPKTNLLFETRVLVS